MSRKFKSVDLRVQSACTVVLPLCLILSACGGGGSGIGVASLPAPPPAPAPAPTPPPQSATPLTTIQGYNLVNSLDVQTSLLASPATRAGNYDLIGQLALTPGAGGHSSSRAVSPGEFSLTVAAPTNGAFNYRLNAAAGILPGSLASAGPTSFRSSWDINQNIAFRYDNPYEDYEQFLGQRLTAFNKATDGTETPLFSFDFTRGTASTFTTLGSANNLRSTFDYDIGYSYVAMGEWAWKVVDLNGAAAGDSGSLLFVNGDRTPASGIPASGTATYDARSFGLLSSAGTPGIPFALTADFGQRTMATRIDQDYRFNGAAGADDPILGIHVGGSAPFNNNGSFDIPLAGTANYASTNLMAAPPAEPVTGSMNGAFFGPAAEQVGGVFSVNRSGGTLLMQDAFVGRQH